MVTLPTYHICLIYTAIESPHQGGLQHQRADKAYVTLLPEATYAFSYAEFDVDHKLAIKLDLA